MHAQLIELNADQEIYWCEVEYRYFQEYFSGILQTENVMLISRFTFNETHPEPLRLSRFMRALRDMKLRISFPIHLYFKSGISLPS